jgi:hypothetical protein
MSKTITPMKRLKGQIDNLKDILDSEYTFDAKEKRNSRIETGSYEWGDRKEHKVISEIVSDHIIFFNSIPKKDAGGIDYKNYSFSIAFDFLNKDIEGHSIQFSLPINDKLVYTKPLTVEDSKEFIRELNKSLKNNESKIRTLVINQVNEFISRNPYDITQDVQKAKEDINKVIENKKSEIGFQETEKHAKKCEDRFNKINNIINSEIESSEEYKELQAIEKRSKELKQKIEEQRNSLKKSYNFLELKNQQCESQSKLNFKQKQLEHTEQQALNTKTSAVVKRIKLS